MYRQQYGEDEMYDDEYEYYYPPTPVENKTEHVRAGFYTFVAVLIAVLAIGGLFLGLIPMLASKTPLVEGEYALSGSLMGIILAVFKGIFGAEGGASIPPFTLAGGLQGLLPMALFYFHFAVIACILFSVIFAIISALPQKANGNNRLPRAGVCAFACGFLTVLGYGGLFLLNLLYFSSDAIVNSYDTFLSLFDFPLAIVAGISLILLIITALKNGARAKKTGFVFLNALMFVLSFAAVLMLANPSNPMLASFNHSLEGTTENVGVKIVSIAAYAVALIGLLITLFRINSKKLQVLSIVLFSLQTVLLFTHALLLALLEEGGAAVFAGLPLLVALIASVVALLLAIIALIVAMQKKKRERKVQEEQASRVTYVEYDSGEYEDDEDEDDDDDEDEEEDEVPYIKVNVPIQLPNQQQPTAETVVAPVTPVAPVAPAAPVAEPLEPYGPYPQRGFQQNIYHQHIYQYPEPQQPAPQPEPQPQPVYQPEPQPQPQPQEPSQTIYQFITQQAPEREQEPTQEPRVKSQFELEMEALARGELKRKESRRKEEEEQGDRPARNGKTTRQSAPQAAAPAVTYFDSQYTYDPFINSLTTPEKNEFCDIFIANKYGSLRYVPSYVIGGDNADFFRKVFIYLGKYRTNISDGLLDKMYYYVSQRN